MSSDPDRPAPVPPDAVFLETTRQWSVGAIDDAGRPVGPHRAYRDDGTLELACHYENGVLEGPFRRFHPNGELAREGSYRGGEIEGRVEAFASSDATGESLRSCCVPPGAVRLEAEYEKGSCLGERFYDDKRQRLLSDGSVYPDRPDGLPVEARFEEWTRRWYVGTYSNDARRETIRYSSLEGTLLEERQTRSGKLDGWLRTFSPGGELVEEAHYEAGMRSGPYRRVLPAPGPYADPSIREERGAFSANFATGVWEFLDKRRNVVRRADLGLAGIDVASSPPLDKGQRTAERWRAVAEDLSAAHRSGEAILAIAREAATARDATWLRAAIDERRPPLTTEEANALAASAIEGADGKIDVLLNALVRGGEPAALLRSIAASCPRASRASLELVNAAILLAPDWDQCLVTRALVQLCLGNPDAAKEDASRLGDDYADQRKFLLEYARILYPRFDFWPARVKFDSLEADLPEEPCQPLSRIREGIQKAATRLALVRGAIIETVGSEPKWHLPDLSGLLPNGPQPLERRNFRVLLDEEEEEPASGEAIRVEEFEEVALDETLELAGRDVASLMRLARADWNILTWLCWSAGLDRVALPDRIVPPQNFSQAVGMAIERQWRAWDKCTTGGLMALTKGVRSFEWEGSDVDFLSPAVAEIAANEFTDLRALFFFLCDDRQESPWQDNLRRG